MGIEEPRTKNLDEDNMDIKKKERKTVAESRVGEVFGKFREARREKERKRERGGEEERTSGGVGMLARKERGKNE